MNDYGYPDEATARAIFAEFYKGLSLALMTMTIDDRSGWRGSFTRGSMSATVSLSKALGVPIEVIEEKTDASA